MLRLRSPLLVHRSLLLAWLGLAVLAPAQSPLFQSLDNSLPQDLQAAGDFDGDGDQDLVVPGAVMVNDGHGRFVRTPVTSLAFFRSQTKAADLNGDGLDDLVATSALLTLQVHLNAGGLNFTTTQTLSLGFSTILPRDFATGDVDGDGDVDLIVATLDFACCAGSAWQPVLFLNDGAGNLTAAPAGAVPAVTLPGERVLLLDLDGDGDRDAIFAGVGFGLHLAVNSGGIFTLAPAQIWTGFFLTVETGRFNGDNLPDLLVTTHNSANVLFSSPTGLLPAVSSPFTAGDVVTHTPIDLNGDGIDEVLRNQDRVLSVLPVVAGALGPPTQGWTDLRLINPQIFDGSVRDFDGDGDRDAIAFGAGGVLMLMSAGNGALVRVGGHFVDVPCGPWHAAGDLDADGDVDVFGHVVFGPVVSTGLNDGSGFFSAGPSSSTSSSSALDFSLFAFDRDGDGDLDLYEALRWVGVPVPPPSPDYVWDNVGGGAFVLAAAVQSTGDARHCLSADFDADGDQDLMMSRWTTTPVPPGAMVLRMNLGAAGLAAPVPIGLPHANYDLDLGDFDGNGTIDVFQTNNVPYSLAGPPHPSVVYLNAGNGTFNAITLPAMSGLFTAVGHLNGDALTDLVIDNKVWFATGGGAFVAGPPLQSALIGPPTLADVDLDGDLDLVETPATLMLNTGGAVFAVPQSFLPRMWSSVNDEQFSHTVAADVDRDGDVDLLAPGPILLSNTTRQLAHGSIPRPGRPGSVDLYGAPGGAWFLFGSNGTTSFPFPPWGTVLIDPTSAQLGALGLFTGPAAPMPGTANFGVNLPNNPALVGWTTYWQAIDATQMRFTNRLTITVMGY